MRERDCFVLIVDDDPDTLLLVSEIVRLAGFSARSSDSLEGAIAAMSKGPAVVLLDQVMPGELCDRFCAMLVEAESLTPVVLMSAETAELLEQKRRSLVARGVNAPVFLRKPFWVDELLTAFAEVWPDELSASRGRSLRPSSSSAFSHDLSGADS